MSNRYTRRCLIALTAAAVLTACSDDGGGVTPVDDPPSEPVDSAPEGPDDAADETAAEDAFAVPEELTVDYVQSVVDELLSIREAAEQQALLDAPLDGPPPELQHAARSIGSPDYSTLMLLDLAEILPDAEAAAERLDRRTFDVRWTVTELLHTEEGCVVFAFDYPPDVAAEEGRHVLLTGFEGRAPEGINPTPWVFDLGGPVELDDFAEGTLIGRCDGQQEFDGADRVPDDGA
jgi:hypothetical protein